MLDDGTLLRTLGWVGLGLGLGLVVLGCARRSAGPFVAAALALGVAAVPRLPNGVDILAGVLATDALVLARVAPYFDASRWAARAGVAILDVTAFAWVASGMGAGVVDGAVWALLAILTIVAWLPVSGAAPSRLWAREPEGDA